MIKRKYLKLLKKYWYKPLAVSCAIIILQLGPVFIPYLKNSPTYSHILMIITIIILTWIVIQFTKTIGDIIINKGFKHSRNNLDAQRINTQMGILVNITTIVLAIIGISLVLMTFSQIRKIGISILASAGIAGIILGMAAQKILGKILAGIQIAFTQPIKIGDNIVVAGELGTVEKINLTYATMTTPDRRQFVIPINYFIENIFQNWTINSSDSLGVIYIEVDYIAPIQMIREALNNILENNDLWDKKFKKLQVVETKSQTIVLRILASTSDPSNAQSLQCDIREQLIEFLQKNYPECLPQVRLKLTTSGATFNFDHPRINV